jgi:probable HAF family extracellular repeat protein
MLAQGLWRAFQGQNFFSGDASMRTSYGLIGLVCALIVSIAQAAGPYDVIDLGKGFVSMPRDVNLGGRTAGHHGHSTSGTPKTWDAMGNRIDLPLLGGSVGAAMGINDSGLIVGRTSTATSPSNNFVAVAWDPTGTSYTVRALAQLGAFPYSSAMGVNNAGYVVGYSHNQTVAAYWVDGHPTSSTRATLWTGPNQSTVVDLGLPGETTSAAFAINVHGQIVGDSQQPSAHSRAILWTEGVPQDLGTLPGGFHSYARGINDHGVVVGKAQTSDGLQAFVWQDGAMSQLPNLGGTLSWAWDINNDGLIVGYSNERAVIWENGQLFDLNSLITGIPTGSHNSGLVLKEAYAVNEMGWIVARGTALNAERAYLLIPVPEPSAVVLLVTAAALSGLAWGCSVLRRRRCG